MIRTTSRRALSCLSGALALCASLTLPARASECFREPDPIHIGEGWTSYDVYVVDIVPKSGQAIDWSTVSTPGLSALPSAATGAQAGLYAARIPGSELGVLGLALAGIGQAEFQRPMQLSAPLGAAARFRHRKGINFVKSETTPLKLGPDSYAEMAVGSAETYLALEITGVSRGAPLTEIRLSWQQVTDWSTAEANGKSWDGKTISTKLRAVLATNEFVMCLLLKPGEALLLGGAPDKDAAQDGTSNYRERAVVIRAQEPN